MYLPPSHSINVDVIHRAKSNISAAPGVANTADRDSIRAGTIRNTHTCLSHSHIGLSSIQTVIFPAGVDSQLSDASDWHTNSGKIQK